jgi:molybdopterin converting factor subunit 1
LRIKHKNTMQLKVLAFGIARDILGQLNIDVTLNENATVSDLKEHLMANYPEFEKLASLRVAVNAEYASDGDTLNPNDEIVIIPPVSGG